MRTVKNISPKRGTSDRGFALVIVLAFVVLLTVVLLALFARAQLNLASEQASSKAVQAGLLAQSAQSLIVSDLRLEMQAGSDVMASTNGFLAMRPAESLSATPFRVVATAVTTDGDFVNLVKQSLRGKFSYPEASDSAYPSNVAYPPRSRAAAISTAVPSGNGRVFPPERWNSARLVSGLGFSATNQVPDWILLARAGVTNDVVSFNSSFAEAKPSNPAFIIGRYAYQIYDLGGLLDANAAGFPAGTTTDGISGTLASVDLGLLPGGGPGSDFYSWRNPGGAATYTNTILNSALPGGYLTNNGLNRLLAGRRDLIKLAEDRGFTNSLPYLTHFSREKNAPAWGPFSNAGDQGGSNGSGNIYAYRDNALAGTSANRFIPNVRFVSAGTVTSYSDAGQPSSRSVLVGEPLLRKRFSLGKLQWIGRNGPQNGGNEAAIRSCFGLYWSGSTWNYVGSDGSGNTPIDSIKTLAEVAQAAREPNFFELLQAGILEGSLGVDNKGYAGTSYVIPYIFQRSKFLQLLTIGANLIDQNDGDSFPTVLRGDLGGQPVRVCGTEALPYFDRFKDVAGTSPDTASAWASYLLVSLWDPYQAEVVPSSADTPKIRVQVQGYYRQDCGWSPDASTVRPFLLRQGTIQGAMEIAKTSYTSFGAGATPLTLANAAPSGGWEATPSISGTSYVGFRMPDANIDSARSIYIDPANSRDRYLVTQLGSPSDPFAFTVEFLDPNTSDWVPYSYSSGIDDIATWRQSTLHYTGGGTTTTGVPSAFSTAGLNAGSFRFKVDPRSSRFNEHQAESMNVDNYFRPLSGLVASTTFQMTPLLFGADWRTPWKPWGLSRNNGSGLEESYVDSDGVRRIADAGLFTTPYTQDTPFTSTSLQPVILNRPFRSVAELSRVFRDQPWKSLDFFSSKSADAGLLELFSLQDEPEIRAGVLNLNTKNPAVLSAVLNDATLAASVINYTATNALISRADLAALSEGAFSSRGNSKSAREAPLQVLASAGQSRTWNLLVDMVVQSGRYPSSATDLAQFQVEGEKRYWLSLAIDRYTGEVIAQTLEPAYDY